MHINCNSSLGSINFIQLKKWTPSCDRPNQLPTSARPAKVSSFLIQLTQTFIWLLLLEDKQLVYLISKIFLTYNWVQLLKRKRTQTSAFRLGIKNHLFNSMLVVRPRLQIWINFWKSTMIWTWMPTSMSGCISTRSNGCRTKRMVLLTPNRPQLMDVKVLLFLSKSAYLI